MTTTPLQMPSDARKTEADLLLSDLLRELEQIPREHWTVLLSFLRLFRKSLGQVEPMSDRALMQVLEFAKTPNPERQASLKALLQSWVDEGDGQEQRETWACLKQAL